MQECRNAGMQECRNAGMQEVYYKIKLFKAHISNIKLIVPHNIIENGNEAQERVSFIYESISWEHCMANTSAYSLWSERTF
ncbi:hypothetical protein N643_15500 [Salmonella bongori serovar 48:z41:-- str. RKS3044]|nr:type VI secretion system tube protein TssD [Salmonella bongori]AID27565.1 hypothetical protein N643_15500 [Salmonella bongori serovar 48:z41:-- str. RKS3044]